MFIETCIIFLYLIHEIVEVPASVRELKDVLNIQDWHNQKYNFRSER